MLRYWRNVPEVLSTLLLGAVAANLMGFGLQKRWLLLAPAAGRANRNQVSEPLDRRTAASRASTWFGNEFPMSVFVAIVLAVIVAIVLGRIGPRVPAARARPQPHRCAARRRRREPRTGSCAMLISGGFAGLAGGVMLTGGDFGNYQLVANFGAGIGFAGLLVALVARQRVLPAIFVAFVFGGLRTGSGFLKSTGLSARIADVVQGLLVLSLLLPPAILYVPQPPPGARQREVEDLTWATSSPRSATSSRRTSRTERGDLRRDPAVRRERRVRRREGRHDQHLGRGR